MTTHFDELFTPDTELPAQQIWAAVIATTPTHFYDRVSVTIPGIDPNLRWENCRWQSRDDVNLPQRGNFCIAALDNNDEVTVLMWWPF